MTYLVPAQFIEKSILFIRGQKVMLDSDLASLYETKTKVLLQSVKRNTERFPADFMFKLNNQEVSILRSQIVTSNDDRGGRRYMPYVFTEYGVAMLSSVLNSPRAIQVNIQIMRTFGRLREILASHKDLACKLNELEKKYDSQFRIVFDAIRELMKPPISSSRPIGFRQGTWPHNPHNPTETTKE